MRRLRAVDVVPRFVREALDVVRQVAGEIDDRGAQPGLGGHARSPEAILDRLREQIGRNLLQPHDRPGLVERPARSNHLLHQARLRAGEHVADLALLLDGGAQGLFDAAAVERGDRLKLIEGDHERAPEARGQAGGQRKDVLGESGRIAGRADAGERDGEPARRRAGFDAQLGRDAAEEIAQPEAEPAALRVEADERARVALEKGDVRAEAAHRHLERDDAPPPERPERLPDERGLPVPAGRDQKDLLAGRQIARPAAPARSRDRRTPRPARFRRRRRG